MGMTDKQLKDHNPWKVKPTFSLQKNSHFLNIRYGKVGHHCDKIRF